VDHFVAISGFVADRVKKFYRRDAVIIHPPVAVDDFSISYRDGDYYLCAGQLVRYKRIDLAVDTFSRSGKRLVVAGTGEEVADLKRRAAPNVEFVGRTSDDQFRSLLQGCRALVFPGEEDFGIVPVEAMACGRPVIAYASGGALETVVDGTTGLFFHEQTIAALEDAIARFERQETAFAVEDIRNHAALFEKSAFKEKFADLISELTLAADKRIAMRSGTFAVP
jgi:glycosyltransferase involved in cell wall biosynthesis